MSHEQHNPLAHPEVRNASASLYITAAVLALAAMCVACLLTVGFDLSGVSTLVWISIMAAIAALGQICLLFRLDLSKTMIWHTVSLVATIPLFVMAIALTIFMFHYLEIRTMIGG